MADGMYKALIVDDEPMAREAVRMAADWESYGFLIAGECENGREALALAESIHPDLILADIRMPDMDGLELARRVLHQIDRDTVFIIISGHNEFAYAKEALKLGIRYFLLKPVFEEDLSGVLKEVLHELERREELKKIAAESMEADLGMFFENLLAGRLCGEDIGKDIPPALLPMKDARWIYAALYMAKGPGEGDDGAAAPGMGYDQLEKAVKSCESADTRIFILFHDASQYGLILCDRSERALDQPWQELAQTLGPVCQRRFYLAVGGTAAGIAGLPCSMAEAEIALEHRFFHPPGSVLLYGEIKDRSLNYSFEGIRYMEGFIDALENLDRDKIAASVTAMFDAFRQSYMAPEMVKMYVVNMIYKSFVILGKMGGISEGVSLSDGMILRLSENPSLADMEQIVREYAERFFRYAQSLRGRDSACLMSKVEDYIRHNYKRSLTIKEIAGKFIIHPTYLGQQICQWFGCGFIEYLHRIRMNEAARLISETDMRIHEIAVELGYASYHNFLEQFVRHFSMKPTEYRERIKKETSGSI